MNGEAADLVLEVNQERRTILVKHAGFLDKLYAAFTQPRLGSCRIVYRKADMAVLAASILLHCLDQRVREKRNGRLTRGQTQQKFKLLGNTLRLVRILCVDPHVRHVHVKELYRITLTHRCHTRFSHLRSHALPTNKAAPSGAALILRQL